MWLTVLVILIALAGAAVLLQLRAILSLVFPTLVIKHLPKGLPLPAATADLYEKATAELATLGFSPPLWVVIAPEKETPGAFAIITAVFCHAGKSALALLQPPLHLAAPNTLTTLFITRLADGRKLTSHAPDILAEALADGTHLAQTTTGVTLAAQWEQHRRWVRHCKTPAAAGFGAQETLSQELRLIRDDDIRLVSTGKLWRDAQGFARPTLAFALRLLWLGWTRSRVKTNKTKVPLARQAMLAMFNEHWQARSLPPQWRWLLLALAWGGGAALLAILCEPALAAIILAALVLHECGRYLAMRAFGYRYAPIRAFPLLSAAFAGFAKTPSATCRAWVAMMSALPGIALGWALYFIVTAYSPHSAPPPAEMMTAALVLLFLNYVALLPTPPFAGDAIVQAVLPPRWFLARMALTIITAIAVVVIAVCLAIDPLPAVLLALLLLLWLPALLVCGRAVRLLAANAAFPGATAEQQRRLALATLQQRAGENVNMAPRLRQAQLVLTALTPAAVTRRHRAILVATYLALLGLPLIIWGAAAIKAPAAPVKAVVAPQTASVPSPSFTNLVQQKQLEQSIFSSLGGLDVPRLLARMPEPKPPAPPANGWLAVFRKPVPPPPPLFPGPADPGKVSAAQTRLGLTFPDDYRELLSLHDGYPPLQLLPIAQVRHLSETRFLANTEAQAPRTFYSFAFPPSSFENAAPESALESFPGQRRWRNDELQSCAVIGGSAEVFTAQDQKNVTFTEVFPTVLWCPDPAFEEARVVSLAESLWAPDFTAYLRYKATRVIAARSLAGEK